MHSHSYQLVQQRTRVATPRDGNESTAVDLNEMKHAHVISK